MQKEFLARFDLVREGVRPTTWCNASGIGRGSLTSMKRGGIPNGATLATLLRVARVSSNYLLAGFGAPFLVSRCDSDREAAHLIPRLAGAGAHATLVRHDHHLTLVLHLAGSEGQPGAEECMPHLEVVAGALGEQAVAALFDRTGEVCHLPVSRDTGQRLVTGWIGNYGLVGHGSQPGLLASAEACGKQAALAWLAEREPATVAREAPAGRDDTGQAAIDQELLQQVVRLVEEELATSGVPLSAGKRAGVIGLLYQLFAESPAQFPDRTKVAQFLRLAG